MSYRVTTIGALEAPCGCSSPRLGFLGIDPRPKVADAALSAAGIDPIAIVHGFLGPQGWGSFVPALLGLTAAAGVAAVVYRARRRPRGKKR